MLGWDCWLVFGYYMLVTGIPYSLEIINQRERKDLGVQCNSAIGSRCTEILGCGSALSPFRLWFGEGVAGNL